MVETITIPVEDYMCLIASNVRINNAYDLITSEHEEAIRCSGMKARAINMKMLEIVLGYKENENYFEKLKKEYEGVNCNGKNKSE